MKLSPGVQIIYIPNHANGDANHPDCEMGFITLITDKGAFCRYWRKDLSELRTKANSELTPIENLVTKQTVNQEKIKEFFRND